MNQPRYRFSFENCSPLRTISSGEVLEIEAPDSDGLGSNLEPLPPEQFACDSQQPFPGNPVYGPIAIEGAMPGDALEIEIIDVAPTRSVARTLLAPNHGFLPNELMQGSNQNPIPKRMYLWDIGGQTARLSNPMGNCPVSVKLSPFIGCIATAGNEPFSSLLAHSHGGNMDVPMLGPGTTLWLPVSVPGALLYVGDIHAAQGHGELVGGALEVSGRVQLKCGVVKNRPLSGPRYRAASGRGSISTRADIAAALQAAFAQMLDWLEEDGLNRYDAYMMLSQCCEFKFGGLSLTSCTVACHYPSP